MRIYKITHREDYNHHIAMVAANSKEEAIAMVGDFFQKMDIDIEEVDLSAPGVLVKAYIVSGSF